MFLSIYSVNSQVSIVKSNISAAGGSQLVGNVSLIFTIGELAINEYDTINNHVSEGFISPDIVNLTGIKDYQVLQGISVYPNPAKDWINISLPSQEKYEIYIYDINGKQILKQQISESGKISVSSLKKANYLLLIVDRVNKLYSINKLIKK